MSGRTLELAYDGLTRVLAVPEPERAGVLAEVILAVFDEYYARSRAIPALAKAAFEARDWPRAVELSQERIAIFSISVTEAVATLGLAIRAADRVGPFWPQVEAAFAPLVAGRYEADLALAFLASIRRQIYQDSWVPVAYDQLAGRTRRGRPGFLHEIACGGRMTAEVVRTVLDLPGIAAPFRDVADDAAVVAARVNAELGLDEDPSLERLEMVRAGFYRNRGAYTLGALYRRGHPVIPFALALLNGPDGVYVDAVILRETTLRHIFSSTLANFHVPVTDYHELVDFLHGLMPSRPRGMHYSTVGYNHVGKLAVMDQITSAFAAAGEEFDHAPGPRGSVAIGFCAVNGDYILKVIRNSPTANYKWEVFPGVEAVLAKYRRVHEINRSGAMLDNILYSNISLPAAMFAEGLLADLMEAAAGTVSLYRDTVFFRHLIVQRRLVPVPLYLQSCARDVAELVVIRLGQCIRNNAASNVFNRDLDGRNYGVNPLRFVSLFDYDAVEPLLDVKVRTNTTREAGEEDIPDWFFEDGVVFLPEELEAHLRLPDRDLRRLFRAAHGELLTVEYWTRMQRLLREGGVPRIRTYPRSTELRPPTPGRRLLG